MPPERVADLQANLHGVRCAKIGTVTEAPRLLVKRHGATVVDLDIDQLQRAWKKPLDLDGTLVGDVT